MLDTVAALSLLGPFAISVNFVVLGVISRRLGSVTHAKPYFFAFFGAAMLMMCAFTVRAAWILNLDSIQQTDSSVWAFAYHLLFATSVTVALGAAWRYWSWLLAERD